MAKGKRVAGKEDKRKAKLEKMLKEKMEKQQEETNKPQEKVVQEPSITQEQTIKPEKPKVEKVEKMSKKEKAEKEPKKKKKGHKVLMVFLCFLLVIVILLGVAGGFVLNKLSMVDYVQIDESNLAINEGVDTGLRNIAIFGVDARRNTYQNTRSDCIMIASINEKTKEVKLTSVYRDSYLEIPGRSLDKATHAYAYGGPELAIQTLNSNLDLDIKEFITVNFYAVVDIVDAVGGIEMEVDSSELKYINNYVHDIEKECGKTSKDVTKTGTQKLDGVQALAYSRIRYTAGGDYKRTERMREVLMAVANKAKSLNVSQLNRVANDILPEIRTNISTGEILSLLPQAVQYKFSNENIGWPYEVDGKMINGVWYGVPINLEANVTRMHKEVFEEEDYTPSEKVKEVSDKIKTKTGVK